MKAIDLTEQKIGRHPRGAWVALSHDTVGAEGRTFEEAYEKAIEKGVKKPLIASTTAPSAPMTLQSAPRLQSGFRGRAGDSVPQCVQQLQQD